jgi:hypothetical protein
MSHVLVNPLRTFAARFLDISFFLANLHNVFLRFVAHVPIPTQKDIEEALLRRKKQELLEMYALDVDMEVPYRIRQLIA